MSDDTGVVVVPMRFGDVDLLVQATPVTLVGSQQTSVGDDLAAAYERA